MVFAITEDTSRSNPQIRCNLCYSSTVPGIYVSSFLWMYLKIQSFHSVVSVDGVIFPNSQNEIRAWRYWRCWCQDKMENRECKQSVRNRESLLSPGQRQKLQNCPQVSYSRLIVTLPGCQHGKVIVGAVWARPEAYLRLFRFITTCYIVVGSVLCARTDATPDCLFISWVQTARRWGALYYSVTL